MLINNSKSLLLLLAFRRIKVLMTFTLAYKCIFRTIKITVVIINLICVSLRMAHSIAHIFCGGPAMSVNILLCTQMVADTTDAQPFCLFYFLESALSIHSLHRWLVTVRRTCSHTGKLFGLSAHCTCQGLFSDSYSFVCHFTFLFFFYN